jgi:hypothetical protein
LEDVFQSTLKIAKKCNPHGTGFRFNGDVKALDSSVIELCLALSPWASSRRDRAGVKLHTSIDLAGDLPDVFVITSARRHDVPIAREFFSFKPGTTVLMDRGYWDKTWLSQLNKSGVFFVTRERRNNRFKVRKSRDTDRTQGYICDQIVTQIPSVKDRTGKLNENYYKGKLRRISYRDPETKKKLTFITNRFDLATSTICKLYKARWKVELFFKALKQNLKVRKFLGNSANAVKAQVYVALIAYLLMQIIRFKYNSKISLPDTMAAVGTLLLLREPLSRLLGVLPRLTRHPPSFQLELPM